MSSTSDMDALRRLSEAILQRSRFLITSHPRPDGDSIGSQVAMAAALRELGKTVRIVNRDPAPPSYVDFPGVSAIEIAPQADGDYDALIVMECGDLARPGVAGLERYFTINIDHHPGNTAYGDLNWFDDSAAACGEMVADLIDVLDVPWSVEIATHLYLTVLTDTGSFRHGPISARTFELCRRAVDFGARAVSVAQTAFDSNSLGKLKLIGALLGRMELAADGRLAILDLDDRLLQETGADAHETDGIINMPFMASDIRASALVRTERDGQVRVSLRSKGDLDVRTIANAFGGDGHRNAAGFTVKGDTATVRRQVVDRLTDVVASLSRQS